MLVRWDRHKAQPDEGDGDTSDGSILDELCAVFAEHDADWRRRHEPREVATAGELNAVFDEMDSDRLLPMRTVSLSTDACPDGAHEADGGGSTFTFAYVPGGGRMSPAQWTGGQPSATLRTWTPVPLDRIRDAAHRFLATGGTCPDNICWRRPDQMLVEWNANEQSAVATVGELDALLNRLDAESRQAPLPYAVTIWTGPDDDVGGGNRGHALTFTIGTKHSPVQWTAPGPPYCRASWNGGLDEEPYFVTNYGGQRSEVDAWMLVPTAEAREGARRFLTSGGQCPDNITWRGTSTSAPAASPAGDAVRDTAALPRKRMAAGALFRDTAGRVLLVEPTYKPSWEVPGGAVEAEESPPAACHREVREELGLDRPVGRLLAVDWVPSRPDLPEGLMLIYDGGVLDDAHVAAIRLPTNELASYQFVAPERVSELVTDRLARRIAACLDAATAGTTLSLNNGYPAG